MTTATQVLREPTVDGTRLPERLFLLYGLVWLALGWAPRDRQDWLLENILVAALVGALVTTRRTLRLSDLSYVLIASFLGLHAVGAHYTYAHVPAGEWAREAFQLSRNHFDRVAHGGFGLLLSYPLQEMLGRLGAARGAWAYYLPVEFTLAASGAFELIEAWLVHLVDARLGEAYLGAQGDVWDAQKDMTAALVGSVVAMGVTAWVRRGR